MNNYVHGNIVCEVNVRENMVRKKYQSISVLCDLAVIVLNGQANKVDWYLDGSLKTLKMNVCSKK